jgi:hypothetical protein
VISPFSELVMMVALVIGAAPFNARGAGATLRPELARLAQIRNAVYPAAARPSRPPRLEQLEGLKDDMALSAPSMVQASASRLEYPASLKDDWTP